MDERVDILDEEGVRTGRTCMKSEAHQKGYWHPCVHVWVFDDESRVLIQQRSEDKDTFPSKWDVSVAGHVAADEDPILAAQRELYEELGIQCQPDELEAVAYFASEFTHPKGIIDKEFHHVYLIKRALCLNQLTFQKEEVNQAAWIPVALLTELKNSSRMSYDLVPYPQDYLLSICELVLERC